MEPTHDCQEPATLALTILDVLDADCWTAVLDYLDANDVVRSERVSRRWQQVVLDYLEGMFKKMGRYIESVAFDCISEYWLREMPQNCPKLQDIRFFRISKQLPIDILVPCKQLRRVVFDSCSGFREYYLDFVVAREESLEEIMIHYCDHSFGYCLKKLKPNKLKTLHLNKCVFNVEHMVVALDRLSELRNLELNDNRPEVLLNLHVCLDKLPKLEHLSLNGYRKIEMGDDLVEAIGRLSGLRHLSLKGNQNVDDAWIAAVASGCKELRVLDISGCEDVSARAIVALSAALAPTLTRLALRGNPDINDADVASIRQRHLTVIRGCHTEPAEAGPAYFTDSDDDRDYDDYRYYWDDSDEGRDSDRIEEYWDSRDADY